MCFSWGSKGKWQTVTVKGWGKRWKGEGVVFQWKSWRKEMGAESAFEGERLSLIWLSLCLKKKTIMKGNGRALWKGKAWVSGYYVFFFFLILCWCGKLWKFQKFRLYIYIYRLVRFAVMWEGEIRIYCTSRILNIYPILNT